MKRVALEPKEKINTNLDFWVRKERSLMKVMKRSFPY